MNPVAAALACACLSFSTPAPAPASSSGRVDHRAPGTAPDTLDIARLLADRFAAYPGVGVVIGIIDANGTRIVAHGVHGDSNPRPVDGNTVFEIGSITKSFTTLLLADMVGKGEVRFDDPVQTLLPATVRVPRRGDKQMTLLHLAMNVSGLPDNPLDVFPTRYDDIQAGFAATEAELYELLGRFELATDPGEKASHSNVAAGLLGHALALRAGMSYPALLERRITGPLGMASTRLDPTPDMRRRRAAGHDSYLRPAGDLEMGALASAGSLKSTVNDLLRLVAAELSDAPGPLRDAMSRQLSAVRLPFGPYKMALQMVIQERPGGNVVFTNGGTFGAQSFLGFDLGRKIGVVALVNATGPVRLVDDIGLHLLTGSALKPIPPPLPRPVERRVVAVRPETLEAYVGRYRLAPDQEIVITRDGSRLFARLPGQGTYRVLAESATNFFWTFVDGQLIFPASEGGKVSGVTLRMGGQDKEATRIP